METLPKRHLLVTVDESEASKKVFDWTLENMVREGDMIHMFHVIPPGSYVVLSTDVGIQEVVEDDEATLRKTEEHARDFLTSTFIPALDERKIPYQLEIVRFATDSDSIGSIICKRADQIQASAVIMAKHNKGALKTFFMGSVSSYTCQHCKAPVCVLHAD